ncbi:MAG: VOC family protein [Ferruginibacter sp.]|nr:VOC family protein [Cytophagales bacterium]
MKEIPHQAVFTAHLQAIYPVVITRQLPDCQRFYTSWFGMQTVFESSWYIMLSTGGKQPFTLAFMHEQHPSSPPSPAAFSGQGSFLTLQVADARLVYEAMKKAGLTITYPLKDEPWGQRRFGLLDPNDMWIDVVEQIEPAPGFWDRYPTEK